MNNNQKWFSCACWGLWYEKKKCFFFYFRVAYIVHCLSALCVACGGKKLRFFLFQIQIGLVCTQVNEYTLSLSLPCAYTTIRCWTTIIRLLGGTRMSASRRNCTIADFKFKYFANPVQVTHILFCHFSRLGSLAVCVRVFVVGWALNFLLLLAVVRRRRSYIGVKDSTTEKLENVVLNQKLCNTKVTLCSHKFQDP